MSKSQGSPTAKPRIRRRYKVLIVVAIVFVAAGVGGVEYARRNAEPILRAKVIQTLSTRFDSQVQLGEFDVTVLKGIGVEGKNLTIRSNLYPNLPPQIGIGQFSFHSGLFDLFLSPMHIGSVDLKNLVVRIPPKGQRTAMSSVKRGGGGKIQIVLDRIVCDDAQVVIQTDNPKSIPLQFDIHKLTLKSVGAGKPMTFKARLINPKPIGDIATQGDFGPWNADSPHSTPIDGTYSFTHADLSTTKGIAGILSSKGKFSGPLDMIAVDGTTDTPDFSVDVSGHPVALRTDFHAIVDGTNGNTELQPVRARFLHTDIIATGLVARAENGQRGHHITLQVVIDKGGIEDLLVLGAKSDTPVMKGAVRLKTSFDLLAGPESVSRRLKLNGEFTVANAAFTSPQVRQKVDELSLRGQGKADLVRQMAEDNATGVIQPPDVPVSLQGAFTMANRTIEFRTLNFRVPGAEISLAGQYSLDGKQLDFAGHARLQAHVSSVVGGWKGKLLTPLDPFLAKNGAGTVVPITITGTQAHPHFGVKF